MSRKVFSAGGTGWQRSRESCSLSPIILHLCISSMKVLRDLGSTEMGHVHSRSRAAGCLVSHGDYLWPDSRYCSDVLRAARHAGTLKRTLVSDRDH